MLTPKTRLEKWLAKIAGESVDIEPKDRLETLLAKIAGDSVTITPDDSLEYWLNEIAENGGGGGSSDFTTVTVTIKSSVSSATSEDDNIGFWGQGRDEDDYEVVTALYKYGTYYTFSYAFDVTTPERVVDIMMCGESFQIASYHPMTASGNASVETITEPTLTYVATVTGNCVLTISEGQ